MQPSCRTATWACTGPSLQLQCLFLCIAASAPLPMHSPQKKNRAALTPGTPGDLVRCWLELGLAVRAARVRVVISWDPGLCSHWMAAGCSVLITTAVNRSWALAWPTLGLRSDPALEKNGQRGYRPPRPGRLHCQHLIHIRLRADLCLLTCPLGPGPPRIRAACDIASVLPLVTAACVFGC